MAQKSSVELPEGTRPEPSVDGAFEPPRLRILPENARNGADRPPGNYIAKRSVTLATALVP